MNHPAVRIVLTLMLALSLLVPARQPVTAQSGTPFPPDGVWTDEFKIGSPNGPIYAMARDPRNGDLYVGGSFTLPSRNVARWDGSRWSPVDQGLDTADPVSALVFDSKGILYAGLDAGSYTNAVYRWTGGAWDMVGERYPKGNSLTGNVLGMAVDSQDRLYVVGNELKVSRNTNKMAVWDASQWLPVSSQINFSRLNAIAIDSRDNIYVGGFYDGGGSNNLPVFAKLNGTTWTDLSSELSLNSAGSFPRVDSLEVGPDDQVYVGGLFDQAGGQPAQNIALWQDTGWRSLGAGLPVEVLKLALHPDGGLYALLWNSPALYHWDGAQWSDMDGAASGPIHTLLIPPDGSLLIGGEFTSVAGVSAPYLARFQDDQWHSTTALATAVNQSVEDIAWMDGKLYAAGRFTRAGGISTTGIAAWDGARWSSVGGGLVSAAYAIEPDGQGGFYVGGYFITAGSIPASKVVHWTGAQWEPLGSGLSGGIDPIVKDLATGPDGSLYAVGNFTSAGGMAANRVARWDGARWYALDSGFNDYSYVETLAFDPDGSLYVGGTFTSAGSSGSAASAAYIARWDGQAWTALGAGLNGAVRGMVYSPTDNSLYVNGQFTQAGGQATAPVARWSIAEQKWYPTQSNNMGGSYYRALSLDPQQRVIFAGSRQLDSRNYYVDDLAWYDGSTWQWMGVEFMGGGSIQTPVLFLSPEAFYVGGSFQSVNRLGTPYLAHWVRPQPVALDFSLEGVEDTPLTLHAPDFTDQFLPTGGLAQVRFNQLPANGALLLSGQPVTAGQAIPAASLGQLSFTPAQDYNGAASLSWSGIDADGRTSPEGALDLRFAPINDNPIAVEDVVSATGAQPVTIAVLANDSDVDSAQLTITSVSQPGHGTAVITSQGAIQYTPEAGYAGVDEFTYAIADGAGGTAQGQVMVHHLPEVVQPPTFWIYIPALSLGR